MTKNYYHIKWAKEMKKEYPDILAKFSISDIVEIWEAYSDTYAAGWLSDERKKVKEVFSKS